MLTIDMNKRIKVNKIMDFLNTMGNMKTLSYISEYNKI
jgi:hypothetical protein